MPELWCFVLLVVAACVLALTPSSRRMLVRGVRSARRARLAVVLPAEWSWQQVTATDAAAWTAAHGRPIAPGRYAAPVFDQHVSRWCGCCYLVAVVQTLEDRLNIALGIDDPHTEAFPCVQYDMQLALDTYNADERARRPVEWNACYGGMPSAVLRSIVQGRTHLALLPTAQTWMGHPRATTAREVGASPLRPVEVLANRPKQIKRRLFRYGPLVLGINSLCLRDETLPERGGLIDASVVSPRDHAVSVVGWCVRGGRECWIVRNSWGTTTRPVRRGEAGCVGEDFNQCAVPTVEWVGDPSNPGYAYVPLDYVGIGGVPTPWFDGLPNELAQVLGE